MCACVCVCVRVCVCVCVRVCVCACAAARQHELERDRIGRAVLAELKHELRTPSTRTRTRTHARTHERTHTHTHKVQVRRMPRLLSNIIFIQRTPQRAHQRARTATPVRSSVLVSAYTCGSAVGRTGRARCNAEHARARAERRGSGRRAVDGAGEAQPRSDGAPARFRMIIPNANAHAMHKRRCVHSKERCVYNKGRRRVRPDRRARVTL